MLGKSEKCSQCLHDLFIIFFGHLAPANKTKNTVFCSANLI